MRTDAQLVTTSFSNENYAAKAKSLVSLCDKELKEKTGGVSNESVQAEMQRRPGMNGRLVIPSVGVNVALFDGHAQRFVDAKDSAAYFLAGNTMLVGDHWNQGFSKIKNCHAGTLAYIHKMMSSAYIQSPAADRTAGFTGGSFQDMTRVAYLNEQMWTQLFVDNRENLCREISGLIERLEQYLAAIAQPDPDRLCAMLRAGRIRKTETEREGLGQ